MGWTRDQETEKRYAFTPRSAISRTSSALRCMWSAAVSPVSPFSTLPGVWLKVSQIDGVRPISRAPPSIWYAAVAVPHRKSGGKLRDMSTPGRGVGVRTGRRGPVAEECAVTAEEGAVSP